MREALGNAFIMNIVIAIVVIIIGVVVSSLAYTKAYKVKNMIISTIESHNTFDASTRAEIDSTLSSMGYKINKNGVQSCNLSEDDGAASTCKSLTTTGSYRYCVYECTTTKGVYYRANSYMYFDLPVIGRMLEFPVHGESKTFYRFDKLN